MPTIGAPRAFLLLVATVVLAACGASASPGEPGAGSSTGGAERAAAPAPAAAPPAASAAGAPADNGPASFVTAPLIIRTGTLSLQVAKLDDALAAAETVVTGAGGYVAASHRTGEGDSASATVTYRLPQDRFEATLTALRGIGQKILGEDVGSQEVTAQVVDLGARITNLRATEAALQKIMAQATKIPDILTVQDQLTATRGQIEELTAQKQSLEQQAAMATLTLQLGLPPTVAVTQVQQQWDPAREADRATATLFSLVQGVANGAIWLAIVVLPVVVVGVLAAIVGLVLWRRFRPRRTLPPTADPAVA